MYVLELAGEDDRFAAAEAGTAARGVAVVAPGLALAETVDAERAAGLAYTRRASHLVAETGASVAEARAALQAADVDREGTVAVRARDIRRTAGIDTSEAERELGSVLLDRGLAVDLENPDHELRALFSADRCLLGWLAVEGVRGYGRRAPTEKPFFQPGSMGSLEARAVANLAGALAGRTLLDPMCGTGGLLVEAGLLGARVVGLDAQPKMVGGARQNLGHFLDGEFEVALGDAARLPVCGSVDAVLFDVPYGRQSKIAGRDRGALVAGALADACRIAPRAVVIADRSLADAARNAGWAVEDRFERRVHRSLVRHVHVLVRQP